jgi:hypothetical protein
MVRAAVIPAIAPCITAGPTDRRPGPAVIRPAVTPKATPIAPPARGETVPAVSREITTATSAATAPAIAAAKASINSRFTILEDTTTVGADV